jgi:hypothetical protein
MSKRAVAAALWFAAIWFGYEILWSVTGVPRGIGPVAAFAVSAFVTVDPLRVFWPRVAGAVRSRASAPVEVSRTPV